MILTWDFVSIVPKRFIFITVTSVFFFWLWLWFCDLLVLHETLSLYPLVGYTFGRLKYITWDGLSTSPPMEVPESWVHPSLATNGSRKTTIHGLWAFFCCINACFCRQHSFPPLHFFFSAKVIFGLNALNGRGCLCQMVH